VLIFVSFFLATFVHGIRTRVIGFGRNIETGGHEWMQPLTSAEFARARIVSNAIVFLPTLLLVTLVHFALIGGYFLTSLVPEALATGTTSIREVVWTLLSRGVLLGIIAWTFVAVGTRLLRASAAVAFLIVLVLVIVSLLQEVDILPELAGESALWAVITLFLLYHVGLTGVVYARLWKKGVIPLRTFAVCATLWALVTGFIYYVTLFDHGSPGDSTPPAWDNLLTSLAYASLVVLPYPAILLDVCRRRHAAKRNQDPAQHEVASAGLSPNSKVAIRVLAVATVLFMLWISWPARPAYETVWRKNGYPVTLAELDAWYKDVPKAENIALKYAAVAEDLDLSSARYSDQALRVDRGIYEKVLIVGYARISRTELIAKDIWDATEEYWEKVTSPIASRLKQLGEGPPHLSRYPIDLLKGYMVDLPHLAPARSLARELSLDALHWTLANNTGEAVESIRAIFPIAESLSEEPVEISQLVRFAILSFASRATATMMNRALPTDEDLARLSKAINLVLPMPDEPLMLKRGIVGQSVLSLSVIGSLDALFAGTSGEEDRALLRSFKETLNPSTANRIVLATIYERHIREASQALRATRARGKKWEDEMNELSFVAPLAMILGTAEARLAESEWRVRMQLEVMRTGLAVERYRLKHGRLPENLEALVPTFLPSVPDDALSEVARPIGYRSTDEGEFVVYSVGLDGEDNHGEESTKSYEGDITFTVAPLHVRTRAQIAP